MTLDDFKPDRELRDALRRFDRAPPRSAPELTALTQRVVANAAPILAQRGGRVSWWEYPAAWARTLIPLGLSTAVLAAAGILWATFVRQPAASQPVAASPAARRAETETMESQRLLYMLVAPVEQHVVPPANGGQR